MELPNNHLVSIVIPAYNVEKYILQTLESVLNQTYRNFEIILVNDGSTDNTEEVARKVLKSGDIPYRIVSQPNRGVSVARNVGIALAQGKYLKLLDGDDLLEKRAIELLITACEEENALITFGKQDVITTFGRKLYRYDDMYEVDWKVADYRRAVTEFLLGKIHIGCNSALLQTNFLRENNVYFKPGARFGEDNEFIAKALYFAKKVFFVDSVICNAVSRGDSVTKTSTLAIFHNVASVKRLQAFFKSRGEEEIARVIENEVLPFMYVWSLGGLAYNGYPYKKWRELLSRQEIKSKFDMFLKDFKPKTKFQRRIDLVRRFCKISPFISYFLLRAVGLVDRIIR
uniref:Glycosyltransferase family 2 protein n=1 Tax=Fervidobacterium thailandense TaxID=1008305 RepID=A0A7C5VKN2_9BACT